MLRQFLPVALRHWFCYMLEVPELEAAVAVNKVQEMRGKNGRLLEATSNVAHKNQRAKKRESGTPVNVTAGFPSVLRHESAGELPVSNRRVGGALWRRVPARLSAVYAHRPCVNMYAMPGRTRCYRFAVVACCCRQR